MDAVTEQDVDRAYQAWMVANRLMAEALAFNAENIIHFLEQEEKALLEYERVYNAFKEQQEKDLKQ